MNKTTVKLEVKLPSGKLSALVALLEMWNCHTREEVAARVRDRGFEAIIGERQVSIFEYGNSRPMLAIVTSTAPDFN